MSDFNTTLTSIRSGIECFNRIKDLASSRHRSVCNELSDLERSISEKLTSFEARLDTIYMEMNSLRENQNEDNQSQTTQNINRLQAEAEQIRQKAVQLESLKSRCEMLSEHYYSSASALMSSITTNASDGVSLMNAYMQKIEGIEGYVVPSAGGMGGAAMSSCGNDPHLKQIEQDRDASLQAAISDSLEDNNGWPSTQGNGGSSCPPPDMSQYRDIVINRHSNSIEVVKRVFDRFSGQLIVQDNNYPPDQTAHYCPVGDTNHPRGVYYSAIKDMTNPRGVGTTYYHELAHMIDHAATGFSSNLSNTERFRDALIADGQQILAFYHNLNGSQQYQFQELLSSDAAHSMSDLVDATTCGELYGSYGHTRKYWSKEGNLQAEAFAHFFEASMGDTYKFNLLSTYFPSAFGVFMELVDSLQSSSNQYVLTRQR